MNQGVLITKNQCNVRACCVGACVRIHIHMHNWMCAAVGVNIYYLQIGQVKGQPPRASIDKEIAASLLDLSKGTEDACKMSITSTEYGLGHTGKPVLELEEIHIIWI